MGSSGPGIRFLPYAGRRVAYTITGDGPPLVAPAWWISHLELDSADPAIRGFWEAVGEGFTLVRYDRLGVGMSDRDIAGEDLGLGADTAILHALIDHLSLDKVTLVGGSSGGCAAIAFAARFPERVGRLLLYGTYAAGSGITSIDVSEALISAVRSHWGLGSRVLADIFLGEADASELERFARYQRASTDPQTAAALLELIYRTDVRAELQLVRAPTVVVHRRGDRAIPYRLARELAVEVRDARLVSLDGTAHFPWVGDAGSVVQALRTALLPRSTPRSAHRSTEDPLTERETEVLSLVARGLSDQEIAQQLIVSQHTVHRHVANIRHKLGASSRTAAVAEAIRLNLI